MIRPLALLALALAAGPALAQGKADQDVMIRVIEARGCVLRDNNDLTVIEQAGLPQPAVFAAIEALVADGRAVIRGNELHLKTGACK